MVRYRSVVCFDTLMPTGGSWKLIRDPPKTCTGFRVRTVEPLVRLEPGPIFMVTLRVHSRGFQPCGDHRGSCRRVSQCLGHANLVLFLTCPCRFKSISLVDLSVHASGGLFPFQF